MDNKKLTPKQKAFADYYIETGNATEAYIRAGYNKKGARGNASRLIANDSIKRYIEERLKEIEDERIADGKEVLQYLTKVMRGEEKDQFGLDASLQDRTKAAELLGKRYRLFVDKVEKDSNVNVNSTTKLDSILNQLKDDDDE
ncbi:terminase small subunit [Clostridium perfringens]|uniref:terminase small subunit n=1 Tax=Clostridium perfringens TaxID=1502 RepID=UPI00099428B8|nr:terminase small subunit [Clostridium perfringens]AQW23482.1 terminase small subunit [Clostridium perfringens]ATD48935.1 terminase small subunit [Clostridium perfringens]EGT4140459.1 terminase small subunit [Clostridium perfringens]KAB8119269.1 terminase small subunit [Clostridium perfringens]MBO3303512.1 terminase small subunit [Clostridium perfringens]